MFWIWWLVAVALLNGVIVITTAHRQSKPIHITPGIATFKVIYAMAVYVVPAVLAILHIVH